MAGNYQHQQPGSSGSAGASAVSLPRSNSSSVDPSYRRLEKKFERRFGHPTQPKMCPEAVAVDKEGNIIVADQTRALIEVFDKNGIWLKVLIGKVIACAVVISPINDNVVIVDEYKTGSFDLKIYERAGYFVKRIASNGVLKGPILMTIDRNNDIVVFEKNRALLKLFNDRNVHQSDVRLLNIGDATNIAAVSEKNKIFIVDSKVKEIKVFTYQGIHIYNFGKDHFAYRPRLIRISQRGRVVVVGNTPNSLLVTIFNLDGVYSSG